MSDVPLLDRTWRRGPGIVRVRLREEVRLCAAAVELDTDNEENGVSGLEESDRNSRPRPCEWDGRTTSSVTDVAGDDGDGVGRAGDTTIGGERERARAS